MRINKPSASMMAVSLLLLASVGASAATVVTGSAGILTPRTDTWTFNLTGEGTLEVTLLQADYSEWFEWSLSGPGGSLGMDEFTPNPWVGPVNELLGSWAVDASTVGMFSFTSTNYPAHPHVAQDYSVEFLFTPTLTNPGGGLEGLIHTPASPVPVPAAVWLFGSSMLGLASMARRKKSR